MWIQCKLDRSFGNKAWFELFPEFNQSFLEKRGSDHHPVLIKLLSAQDSYRGQFRFNKRMLHKPLVKENIMASWNSVSQQGFGTVSERIRRCRKALSNWKKKNSMNALDKINQIQNSLEREECKLRPCFFRINRIKRDLLSAYKEEELFWSQKSSQTWLKEGDGNTWFFHASVKENRTKRFLKMLVDERGYEQRAEASKGEVASQYFNQLFASSNPDSFHQMFHDFRPRINDVMNEEPIRTVSKDEIKEAIFSINPTKAPGADGMTGLFFQQYWGIIGVQVTREIQNFFETGLIPTEWNYTQLCLIPKKSGATKMTELRPISLCTVIYKAISKILVKRLKPLLPVLISPFQSTFVEERLISDNIIISHEVVHGLRTHPKVSSKYMAVKSDMSKAFDRVKWSFLKSLLTALGFHCKWIEWIFACMPTVTYSVMINDQPHGLIVPKRSLCSVY